MKCAIVVFVTIVAAASAGLLPYHGLGYAAPLHHAYAASYHAYPYASIAHHGYAAAPLAYHAFAAPAVQSGYVAATRGSVHTAPLPEGPFAASHHINTAPAPGTF